MAVLFDNRYELLHNIGNEYYGEVWLAKDIYTEEKVTIKIYVLSRYHEYDMVVRIKQQAEDFGRLHHPNLLSLLKMGICGGNLYVVMPYCASGTIEKLRGEVSEAIIWRIINDIASALEYLHKFGLVNWDIKPANILIGDDGNYLIFDYGLDHFIMFYGRSGHISIGGWRDYTYRSPECVHSEQRPCSESAIWSLGAVLFELITEESYILKDKNISSFGYSRRLCKTIQACLSLSPQNRPSARELIEISGIMLSPNLWTNIICYCEKAWAKIFSNKYRSCARHELRV